MAGPMTQPTVTAGVPAPRARPRRGGGTSWPQMLLLALGALLWYRRGHPAK